MCARARAHTCVFVLYVYICVHTRSRTRACLGLCLCLYAFVFVCARARVRMYLCVCVCVLARVRVLECMCACVRARKGRVWYGERDEETRARSGGRQLPLSRRGIQHRRRARRGCLHVRARASGHVRASLQGIVSSVRVGRMLQHFACCYGGIILLLCMLWRHAAHAVHAMAALSCEYYGASWRPRATGASCCT